MLARASIERVVIEPMFDARDAEHAFPCADAERVLLVNPPVYDVRFPWAAWQQPAFLLRLGSLFGTQGCEVRLLDALACGSGERLLRKRVDILDLDGSSVNKWRFGATTANLASQLAQLRKIDWHPHRVYVECFASFWWEGAAEAIRLVRRQFPDSRITLVGALADLVARQMPDDSAPDDAMTGPPAELGALSADLSLYAHPPALVRISLQQAGRSPERALEHIKEAAARSVRSFAFADEFIAARLPQEYCAVLELLAAAKLRIAPYALGNILPGDLTAVPELASLMKRAGYREIYFADDRHLDLSADTEATLAEEYRQAAERCREAGFRMRTRAVTGGLSVGRRGEDLQNRARLATLVSHQIGGIILWPYQPAPHECPELPLEAQNGKLFPLRHLNGLLYRDYTNLLGLAAVLNAKYRDCTFDFLGDGLISTLFRDSLAREAWNPDPEIKGQLHLPMIAR